MTCGSVKLVRTMYGDAWVMLEVAAAITTIGVLLCVAIGAVASAVGVRPKPASTVDLVVDDQLLREAAGRVGHAAVVLEDDLDLAAGDLVAVLRHAELDGGVDLAAGGRLRAGHRQDQADLDRPGVGGMCQGHRQGRACQSQTQRSARKTFAEVHGGHHCRREPFSSRLAFERLTTRDASDSPEPANGARHL